MFMEYDNTQAGRRAIAATDGNQNSKVINYKSLKKEALVALRLEQAQCNFQDNLTES